MTASVRDRRRELVERRIKQVGEAGDEAGHDPDALATLLEPEQLIWDQLELLEKATQRAKVIGIGRNVGTCECCDDDEET